MDLDWPGAFSEALPWSKAQKGNQRHQQAKNYNYLVSFHILVAEPVDSGGMVYRNH